MAKTASTPTDDNTAQTEALVAKVQEKGFTALQENFADYVTEMAAPEFKTVKERDAFRQGAGYALVLRMAHQGSPQAKAFHAGSAQRAADAKAAREQAAADRKAARAAKAEAPKAAPKRAAAKAKAEPAAPKAAPTRRARAAAAEKPAATTAKATPARRPAASTRPGRPQRKTAATKSEVDF